MHYLTEERGHPHSPDYRIYFSKLTIATMMGETECVPCVQVTGVWQDEVSDSKPQLDLQVQVEVWPLELEARGFVDMWRS